MDAGVRMVRPSMAMVGSWRFRVAKRVFDVAFSLLVLTVAALPMALIALAIKLTSAGPVLFVQERVGRHGRCFPMFKFRTMRVQPMAASDTVWTVANDRRCTGIGGFLRRTSLDELPQFFNVLRGEMSVVGPRPERPFFAGQFGEQIEAYDRRHQVMVGITGWAQVNGWRGDTDIRQRVACDLYYIRNWSLLLDLRIVLMTLLAVFFPRNAY